MSGYKAISPFKSFDICEIQNDEIALKANSYANGPLKKSFM